MTSAHVTPRTRASLYIFILLAINFYFVKKLFVVDFTNNMQHNAGSFMAISRFIQLHWPHLDWYPWWFAGEPFENSYTPMLQLIDAAVASMAGWSTARAFNFVTGFFYVTGPVFLFLFSWRISRFLETSFFAALIYSLFSPSLIFKVFRFDVGSLWNPWRVKTLIFYGEGPHTVVLAALPLALLLTYLAIQRRRYIWMLAAASAMAFLVLVNAFGAVDLGIGCACLLAALPLKQIPRALLLVMGLAIAAYVWASPFLTPSLIQTISLNSQAVGGDFSMRAMLPTQALIIAGFAVLWFLTRPLPDPFTRFSLLFGYVFLAVTTAFALWNKAALPQPNRYSLEMDLAIPLAIAFLMRPIVRRLSRDVCVAGLTLFAVLAVHQIIQFGRYTRTVTRAIDITRTIEYKVAKAFDTHVGGLRAFVTAQAGTWLNVFSNTPQMNSGHDPFSPNWVVGMATFTIFSGMNAGTHDAENSIVWLKALGCHAIYVPGPNSRLDAKPFDHPAKFAGILPVLWHEEDDTIYSVPQRTQSLAHVIPEAAVVAHRPVNGLDTAEAVRYIAALDDPAMPPAIMTWPSPSEGHARTVLHPGQVLSVQVTYDRGWIARANGRDSPVTRDGIGMSEVHAACDGDCAIDFIFDGGLERKICRYLSWTVWFGALLGVAVTHRLRRLY